MVFSPPALLLPPLLWLLFLPSTPVHAQNAICPLGFVWGGLCGFGVLCPPSLPPFHCLRGSCCRDQRPLFARLGPIVYPQDLLNFNNGFGTIFPQTLFPAINPLISTIGLNTLCLDNALNCYLYTSYCFSPVYQLCMATHCRRTCGYCSLGLGLNSGFGLNSLGFNNIGTLNGLNGLGTLNGLNGLGTLNGLGAFG